MLDNYLDINFSLKPKKFFDEFAIDFKKTIESTLPKEVRLAVCNSNFYYVSGFLVSTICERCINGDINHNCANMVKGIVGECKNPKYAYFSISDVRHFKNEWYDNILLRSAKRLDDFTGGANGFTTLENFGKDAKRIMEAQMRR